MTPERQQLIANSTEYLRQAARYSSVQGFVKPVLDDGRFKLCCGGASHHHVFDGGLVTHTAEVLRSVLAATAELPGYDCYTLEVLIIATIWHDYGKIFEYNRNPAGVWESNKTQKEIGHITISHLRFQEHFQRMRVHPEHHKNPLLNYEINNRIAHCILAHHGRKEWGSPVEPRTAEALLLHQADYMSSRFGATAFLKQEE